MALSFKEMIVVCLIAAAIFRLAKPIALRFCTQEDFSRRRNAWFVLTAASFLSPTFWIFALIAVPVLIIVGRKDSNPGAVYLFLLSVIPPIGFPLPMVGISKLFDIDIYILLAIFVMMPAALRMRRSEQHQVFRRLRTMDALILSYGILTAFFYLQPEISSGVLSPFTFTDAVRRAFVFFIETYIPYWAISRSILSRQVLVEDLAAFTLACALMAGVAIFESSSHWLLFGELAERWGQPQSFSLYYWRGDSLRAMASAGHPLALGYLLEIALGFWLYLQSHSIPMRHRIGVILLLCLGLFMTYSRGPWLSACCIFLVYYLLMPRAWSRRFKAGTIAAIVAVVISFTPLGDKIVKALPFFGDSPEDASVVYRHRLFDRTWQIIQESPLLGDQQSLLKLQDLRQGEGIIDVINTYSNVLLGSGFLGLSLFLGFILLGAVNAWALSRRMALVDADFSMMGACVVACIAGTILMMIDGSFGSGLERMIYVLAAIASGYAYLARSRQVPMGVTNIQVSGNKSD
jgi:O-antigen ligase